MKKKIILFDVDGTLIDSFEGIINSLIYTANVLGYKVDEKKYRLFIGPPLTFSFKKYLNMPDKDIDNAIEIYREQYLKKGRFEYRLYDGVLTTLDELKKRGKIISTATSKPEYMTKKIFERENLMEKFDYIFGSVTKDDHKIDVLKRAIKGCNNDNINDYVLIGDTNFDLEAATKLGMDCILVKEGYGDEVTFNSAKYIVNKIEDILSIIE